MLVHEELIRVLSRLVSESDKTGHQVFDGKGGRPSYTAWQNWQAGASPRLSHLAAVAARLGRNLLIDLPLSDSPDTVSPPTTEGEVLDDELAHLMEQIHALPP